VEEKIIFLLIGLVLGWVVGWWMTQGRLRSLLQHLQEELSDLKGKKEAQDEMVQALSSQLASRDQQIAHLGEKLNGQAQDLNRLQQHFEQSFERTAGRLLEEKGQVLVKQQEQVLQLLLNPLQARLKEFEQGIQERYLDETKERISLKKEIEQLHGLNQQLSQDAGRLVDALRGDSKAQGDWGEFRLEMLLEKSGLEKGIHFIAQPSYKDQNGQQKRPDFIINLPNDKHLVIDSKVSLTAYERFYHCEDEDERAGYLKDHLTSLRKHIKDLKSKNYTHLYQINSPDYLLLFVPVEPAFNAAIRADQNLFIEALEKDIVLVTTSTLLATMRTVSYIWQQERQKKNVLEIARQSGLLYDKFVAFVKDLKQVGERLDQAQVTYQAALNKLQDSPKFGDTLIGRAERIKALGAKASKTLSREVGDEQGELF